MCLHVVSGLTQGSGKPVAVGFGLPHVETGYLQGKWMAFGEF
jgi:hypothetical protein